MTFTRGIAHCRYPSSTAETVSLSARFTIGFIAREVQRNEDRPRDRRRLASASARSSETTEPIDRPFVDGLDLSQNGIIDVERRPHDV
jgi:hypothetical protein